MAVKLRSLQEIQLTAVFVSAVVMFALVDFPARDELYRPSVTTLQTHFLLSSLTFVGNVLLGKTVIVF